MTALCPDCEQSATRVHSRYTRTLADLPQGGTPVRLVLQVRRFFCRSEACLRLTFVEQIPTVTARHAQHTVRLNETLTLLGLALGGEGGARIVDRLAMRVSPDTLLRRVRQLAAPASATPRVLGVDDFAMRKGRTYGTILCDLERRCPLDLLPDRSADTLATWLAAHPGVEIISRDRASAYAEGASRGAPQAVQVADRFHLVKNLGDAVESMLQRHRPHLQRTTLPGDASTPDLAAAPSLPAPTAPARVNLGSPCRAETARLERRVRRLERYTQVIVLREQGLNLPTIAARLGVSRRTVTRFLAADSFPERKRRTSGPGQLDPYVPYLVARWDAGCHNATQLWRELCAQGYVHSRALVFNYVTRLRKDERPLQTSQTPAVPPERVAVQRSSPREAKWLFLRHPTALDVAEQGDLAALHQRGGELATTYVLTQGFTEMVRGRKVEMLESWLTAAQASAVPELRSLANGIERDKAAVIAGLTLPWSQGPVEGHVNRLKLIKRQMFGRAKIDLLRQRVVHRV